jgi:hypothetical protein
VSTLLRQLFTLSRGIKDGAEPTVKHTDTGYTTQSEPPRLEDAPLARVVDAGTMTLRPVQALKK